MSYSLAVKNIAYYLDPGCWVSYSGKPIEFKREMELRREASLRLAQFRIMRRPLRSSRPCPRRQWLTGQWTDPTRSRLRSWWTSNTMRAVCLQRNFDETGIDYLRRKATEEGLRLDQYAMLAYCAALSQGRSSWR